MEMTDGQKLIKTILSEELKAIIMEKNNYLHLGDCVQSSVGKCLANKSERKKYTALLIVISGTSSSHLNSNTFLRAFSIEKGHFEPKVKIKALPFSCQYFPRDYYYNSE